MTIFEPNKFYEPMMPFLERHKTHSIHLQKDKDGRSYLYWGDERFNSEEAESLVSRMSTVFQEKHLVKCFAVDFGVLNDDIP
jgi:hypothetical protein